MVLSQPLSKLSHCANKRLLTIFSFVWDSINHKESFRTDLPKSLADTGKHWDSLQLRIAFACTRIWDVVKDILCNDSPEGHLPQDLDEGDFIDTKDVLSYSFRAVHESRCVTNIF
jgi:hypothetical protein